MASKVTFVGSQGDQLAARLDLPPGEVTSIALFAHCFTCSKDIAAASRISAGLVAEGFGVLRFDFTGLGSSEGEFANTNFTSNVQDLLAAADFLRDEHRAPSLLIGHSLGGAAVLAAARHIPEVQAVATIAAPCDPAHVAGVFGADTLAEIANSGEAEVSLAGRPFEIRQQFIDDIERQKLTDDIAHLDAALLVMHSPEDELVGVNHARWIYEAARHPKTFVSLDEADHLLTDRRDSAYVARVIAAWASRYVPTIDTDEGGDTDKDGASSQPAKGLVIVEESGVGTYAQHVRAGTHVLAADEPAGVGDDTGPNPYDLLLAGLGACTSMTLRMYAERKGLALEHVKVTLSHSRSHSEDCEQADEDNCRIETLDRQIELTGELTAEQRDKLATIADKCPVHRTLTGDLRVTTTVS